MYEQKLSALTYFICYLLKCLQAQTTHEMLYKFNMFYLFVIHAVWLSWDNFTSNTLISSINIVSLHYAKHYDLYIWGQGESSRPSLRETKDKRPFSRDMNRSWCHCHTTSMMKLYGHWQQHKGKVKSSWPGLQLTWNSRQELVLQPMDPWMGAAAHSYAAAEVLGAMGCDQKALH